MNIANKIFFSFIISLLFLPAHAQENNHLHEWNLKGKVKTVTAQEWVTRDSLGQAVNKKMKLDIGLFGHFTKFDTAGYIVSSTNIDSLNGKKAQYKTYNSLHELTSLTHLHKDGSKTTTRYVYENLGGNRLQYIENEKGRTISSINTNNAQNRLAESNVFSAPDTLAYKITYTYDEQGNLAGMTTENANKRKEVWGWKWKNGVKVQAIQTTYENDIRKSVANYLYDNAGNVVRKVEVFGKGEPQQSTIYKYTFDAKGNWVSRQMQIMRGNSVAGSYYAERSFTYYE